MEKIRVLGISASPRKHGSSQYLLEVALESARDFAPEYIETELYSCSGKLFKPCDACDLCHTIYGHCKVEDDDFAELRDKWIAADAVLYSIPVYHMGIPGNFKPFLDRIGQSVVEGFTEKDLKVMGTIAQGSGMATGQESVMSQMLNHAVMMSGIPVGSDWPAAYIGSAGWNRLINDVHGIEKLNEEGDETAKIAVDSVKVMARNLVSLAMIIKAGGLARQQELEEGGGYAIFLRRIRNGS
jgi:multimeric flavodoxin WrbA